MTATRRERRRRDRARHPAAPRGGSDPKLRLTPLHVVVLSLGLLVAVFGFWLLSRGSIAAAPALLLLAFLVLLPVGLALPAREGGRGERNEPANRREG